MKYAVVVCPKCKKPKAVLLSNKTSKCTRCNKILKIDKIKIFYKSNSEEEIRQAIGILNAELDGKKVDFFKILSKK